jgi:ketosteroid isomerase-like protein
MTLLRSAASIVLIVSASLSSGARADDSGALSDFKAAIRAQYDMREKAFNSKDIETLVNRFYTADAISVPPGDEITIGREQLLTAFKAHSAMKAHIVSYRSYVNGDNGVDLANFYYTPDDSKEKPGVLKMLFLWEKRQGHWVCIGDMFVPGQFPIPASKH